MRKVLIAAVLAGVALGGVAACSSGTPSNGTTTPAASSTTQDETKDVCTQAIAMEKQNGAAVIAKIQAAFASIAAGGTVDPQLQSDLLKIQSDWVTAFNGFAAKPIKPEVKTAITNFVTYVQSFVASGNSQTLPQATAKFNELDQALTAACA
jgi:hypothetical protein